MQTDGVLRSRVLFLDYESYQMSYQKPFSPAGRSPQARSLPTLSANGYLWMHQSTPPLPGFNAIRIDYIDSVRGHNLRLSLQNSCNTPMNHCVWWWSFASRGKPPWTFCPSPSPAIITLSRPTHLPLLWCSLYSSPFTLMYREYVRLLYIVHNVTYILLKHCNNII